MLNFNYHESIWSILYDMTEQGALVVAAFESSAALASTIRRSGLETGPFAFFVAPETNYRHGNL